MSDEEESINFCKNERQTVTIYHVNIKSCSLVHGTKIIFFKYPKYDIHNRCVNLNDIINIYIYIFCQQ